jgi:S1-C subfamily serine protease
MCRRSLFTGAALVSLVAAAGAFGPLAAAEETAPSCLEAVCKVKTGNQSGSGVVYHEDSGKYYILTARHLVKPVEGATAPKTNLQFFHAGWVSKSIPATIEFTSEAADDVAVISVKKSNCIPYPAPTIIGLQSCEVKEGQRVITIGVSQANDTAAWPISMIGRVTEVPSRSKVNFQPTNNPSNLGGALITDDGKQLVGICTAISKQASNNRAVSGTHILGLLPDTLK